MFCPPVRPHRSWHRFIVFALAIAGLAVASPSQAAQPKPADPKGADGRAKAAATPKANAASPTKKPGPARTKRRRGATPGSAAEAAPHHIVDTAPKIVAFPRDVDAVSKAFADHRREQLADVEKAARAPKQDDRWNTVLFLLRDLDGGRGDPESCFWRVVAYYRLGEVRRARAIRSGCSFNVQDASALESEDATAAALQPATALADLKANDDRQGETSGKPAGEVVANAAPYGGPTPARSK